MALIGAGMLCTRMDVEFDGEAEFSRWYDKEHMEERASIPGFLNSRRYVALAGDPKYLNLYDTESLAALSSPVYQKALQNQTDWSKRMMAGFRNFHRTVGSIDVSVGAGHGVVVGFVWFHPAAGRHDALREWFRTTGFAGLADADDIVSAHLLESDPELSGSLPEVQAAADEGPVDDWYAIVEGINPVTITSVCQERFAPAVLEGSGDATFASFGVYSLLSAFGMQNGKG
jgi:hypothetical protein